MAGCRSTIPRFCTSTEQLLDAVRLDRARAPVALDFNPAFRCLVPRSYVSRMRPGDWTDPLLAQVLALRDENVRVRGFSTDPVGDSRSEVMPGLLHKYRSRALLMATAACAIHCRYCFRRGYDFEGAGRSQRDIDMVWRYLGADPGIEELVLSGGDPFMLTPHLLRQWLRPSLKVPNVTTIRFHTRVPVAAPSMVGARLVNVVRWIALHKTCVVVVHANCAQELDPCVRRALGRMREAGAVLLNQAVLLRGVNDTVDAQVLLSRSLAQAGVMPYYLHQLDRAQGTAHFEVSTRRGRALMRSLRDRLPGYLVPRYVAERAGAPCKVVLA